MCAVLAAGVLYLWRLLTSARGSLLKQLCYLWPLPDSTMGNACRCQPGDSACAGPAVRACAVLAAHARREPAAQHPHRARWHSHWYGDPDTHHRLLGHHPGLPSPPSELYRPLIISDSFSCRHANYAGQLVHAASSSLQLMLSLCLLLMTSVSYHASLAAPMLCRMKTLVLMSCCEILWRRKPLISCRSDSRCPERRLLLCRRCAWHSQCRSPLDW